MILIKVQYRVSQMRSPTYYLTMTASPKENYAFSGWEIVKEVDYNVSKNQSTIDAQFSRIFLNNKESPELILIRGYTYHFRCDLNESDQFLSQPHPLLMKLSLLISLT